VGACTAVITHSSPSETTSTAVRRIFGTLLVLAGGIIDGTSDTHLELLRLVNLGLLDQMAQAPPQTQPSSAPLPVDVSGAPERAQQRRPARLGRKNWRNRSARS
jgi:hypothetical protein